MTAQILEISGPGVQGPPGTAFRPQAGAPDNSVGINGDVWLNTDTGQLYLREAGVYVLKGSIVGPPGPAGAASLIRSGTSAPDNSVGNNQDVYLNTATGTVYQKLSGLYQVRGTMTGPAGTPGTKWNLSTSDPDNSVGIDGDLWLKTTTGQYWKKISGTYSLQGNLTGPAGAGGSATQWLTGSGVPSNESGSNGDFYLRSNGEVYQKSGGAWAMVANFTGPTGPSMSVSEVADLTARDAISGGSLVVGMIVFVRSTREWYKLASTGPTVWTRVAGQTETREWYVPSTNMDDSSGVSPGDPTAHIQSWIDSASSAYNATLGRIVLIFPSGRWQADEITLKGKVRYRFMGDTIIRRRSDATSTTNRSIVRTQRRTGINTNGTTQAFSSWVTSPLDMSVSDNWYGDSDDISIEGPGRLILDPGTKACALAHFRCLEVRRMFIAPGALEIWHGPNENQRVWASTISAREMHWFSPIVRGGTKPWMDGIHFTHGNNINVHGGFVESGDDAFVCQNTAGGGSTAGPDEAIEDVTIVGAVCYSTQARAVNASAGVNWISMPWVNGGGTVRRFTARGITGWSAQTHGHAFAAHADAAADSIYSYTVTSAGSGGTNGTYKCPVVSGDGNGSGAFCFVTVSGGAITAATIWWDSALSSSGTGAFAVGSGYKVNGTVNLSGITGLTGGAITARIAGVDNSRLTDISYDFNIRQGSATHDNTEPYSVVIKGASRVRVTGHIRTVQSATPLHRPFYIFSGDDIELSVKYDGAFEKAGMIHQASYPGSVVDNIRFAGCGFTANNDSGGGVVKVLGSVGNIYLDRCIFRDVPNSRQAIRLADLEGSVTTTIRRLEITGCRLIPASGSPTSVRAILFVHNSGGTYGQIQHLHMVGNDWSLVPTWDSQQTWQDSVLAWKIADNAGFKSKFRKVVTVGAAATSQAFTTGTNLGFPGGAQDINSACLSITPINLPTNPVSWACAVTAVDSATISLSGVPGGGGQKFAVFIDCSARPVDTNAG